MHATTTGWPGTTFLFFLGKIVTALTFSRVCGIFEGRCGLFENGIFALEKKWEKINKYLNYSYKYIGSRHLHFYPDIYFIKILQKNHKVIRNFIRNLSKILTGLTNTDDSTHW